MALTPSVTAMAALESQGFALAAVEMARLLFRSILGICPHRLGGDLGCHHALTQPGEHSLLQDLAINGRGVVAAMGEQTIGACVAVLSPAGVTPTAAPVEQEPGQQRAGPVGALSLPLAATTRRAPTVF